MVPATSFAWVLTKLLLALDALVLAQADETGTHKSSSSSSPPQQASTTATVTTSRSAAHAVVTSSAVLAPGVCEARTINYITHTLLQSCLTSSWASARPAVAAGEPTGSDATNSSSADSAASSRQSAVNSTATADAAPDTPAAAAEETQTADAAASTFMSFEDWKEMMLRKAGQDPQEWRSRKPSEHPADDRSPPEAGHAGLGEEDEISLNFDQYSDGHDKGRATPGGAGPDADRATHDAQVYGDGKATAGHRSKDAGKTCKERFSYSSFDAGATVLKWAAGAKNAKAILVENKDSYMLLECAAASKYVIVELSDDILVDTIVVANFEFFSSMVRHFRVSVSDRYPVKMEKWRELGTFEARNSRDIQPFLVENPQIWAKYVRIEFLTHYGNEYYCPVSLLRVHGSRMLDSWKDSETGRDDDAQIEGDNNSRSLIHGETSETPASTPRADTHEGGVQHVNVTSTCPVVDTNPVVVRGVTCPASEAPRSQTPTPVKDARPPNEGTEYLDHADTPMSPTTQATRASTTPRLAPPESAPSTPAPSSGGPNSTVSSSDSRQTVARNATNGSAGAAGTNGSAGDRNSSTVASSSSKTTVSGASSGKSRGSGTSGGPAASPTVQEGFFNAITKRLQQVESNLTLSLKYVEDQSRHVQEALQRGEQRQHGKVTGFLNELNQTVLAELRTIREQYDQIWQSTVLALESQAQRSERDMMALSTRLNVLADEVVFQKRMAIVQAVILLSCLFLVIFSRGVVLPSLGPLSDQGAGTSYTAPSTPGTPRRDVYRTNGPMYQGSYQSKKDYTDSHAHLTDSRTLPSGRRELIKSPSPSCDSISAAHLSETQIAPSEYRRLSPPLTPNISAGDTGTPHHPASPEPDVSEDHGVTTARRSSNVANVSSRKPLPSLPEHPSPPR
ncbi:Sad1/UNC domain-containing protein [Purpureocillium lavendulum]|uniref:Sad1/UNC domain-containing protein n=1 Tax=Purpureocillium lavendulum TaxID=1247861 RepID=A0AB34FP68_9HYPO|nr:Sad1/UNC domain-containing protein [Purpureocillium lavendulum]